VVSRRGYKSGGFNTLSAIAGPQQRFAPEYLTDVEAGVKKDFRLGDMRGRVNLAAFTGDYEDIQRSVIVAATTSATINAAKATIRGFELEASLNPFEGLELYGYWSYLDAQYDEYLNPFTGQDLSDAVFPNSPEHKLSLTARYRLPFDEELGGVYVSGTVYHQTRTAFSDDNLNFPPAFGGEYTLANFTLDWENVAGRPVDASLFVKNAFDENYISGAGLVNSAIYGFATLYYGEPRTWGLQLRYRFGASAD
jgi:iron complex outermembrane receptor protein